MLKNIWPQSSICQQNRDVSNAGREFARPAGVSLVACFQILKAAVLLLAALLLAWRPNAVDRTHSVLYPLVYIATRGRYPVIHTLTQGGTLLPGFLAVLGVYLGTIAVGLWRVRRWARRTVMLTCGVALLLWARTTIWPGIAASGGVAAPDLYYFHLLIALDAIMFVYLTRGKTLAAFQEAGWRLGRRAVQTS